MAAPADPSFGRPADGIADGPADAHEALRTILDLVPTIAPDTPLAEILQLLTDTVSRALRCRYVAASVFAANAHSPMFVMSVIDSDSEGHADPAPTKRTLLAAVDESLDVVRWSAADRDVPAAGGSVSQMGFRSLLAVPVMRGDVLLGRMFLADPNPQRDFDADDELVSRVVAGAVGAFIERAAVQADFEQRQRWLAETAKLTRDLLSGVHADPLQLIADRVRELAAADEVLVARPAGPESLVVDVGSGVNARPLRGRHLPVTARLGRDVLESGAAVLIPRLSESEVPESLRTLLDVESSVIVPLRGVGYDRSLLGVGRRGGRPTFTDTEVELASLFADQMALALEFAESRAHRERVALLEERGRIARDLHDHVIQQLFAIGLSLERTATRLGDETSKDVAMQLDTSVQDIDATITRIRATIHRLNGPVTSAHELLRVQADDLIAEMAHPLGFRPELEMHGPVVFTLDRRVIDDCAAVLREALTNTARHAGATSANVLITIAHLSLVLEVRDNGRGIGAAARRSGLANLRTRAERHGGRLSVWSSRGYGTRVTWSIPLSGNAL